MKKIIRAVLALAIFAQTTTQAADPVSGNAGAGKKAQPQKFSELPPLIQTQLATGNVGDGIRAMGVTRPTLGSGGSQIDSNGVLDTKVKTGFRVYDKIDLVGFEVNAISDFLQAKGIFAGEKDALASRGFIVLRYGLEDDRALHLFQKVRTMGIHSAVLVTDGPISMDNTKAQFGTHDDGTGKSVPNDYTNDIRPEYFLDRANGKDLKTMYDSGYKLYSPVLPKVGNLIEPNDFYMTMSAIANPKLDRVPIMHEKEVIMYILKDPKGAVVPENIKKIYVIHGTGNWTRIHYNRNFIYEDTSKKFEGPGAFAFKHAMNTLETFARDGKSARISEVPTPGRQRINDAQGNSWEMGYSDGRYELNQRMVDELNMMAGNEETLQRLANGDQTEYARLKAISENVKINEVVLSHFVMTNSRVMDALADLWKAQKAKGNPFYIRGGLDAKFVGLRSFGLGAIMAGYNVQNSFGGIKRSLGKEFMKYVDVVVQMEQVPGAKDIDPDGPPLDRVLWHDKTTMISYELGAEKRSSIYTGSYNNSNNFNNMERQDWLSVAAEHPVARAVRDSITSSMQVTLKGPRKGLPLDAGVFAIEMGTFLGQTPADLNWEELAKIRAQLETLQKQDPKQRELILKEVEFELKRQARFPSRLISRLQVSADNLKTRLSTMMKFFSWYSQQPSFRQGVDPSISANEMLSLALAILEKPLSAKMALRDIFWRPGLPDQSIEARAYQIYQVMGLEAVFAKILPAGQSAQFPFHEKTVFSADLMDAKTQKKILDLMLVGKSVEASVAVKTWMDSSAGASAKSSLAADPTEIAKRMNGYLAAANWYQSLAVDPSFPYPTVSLKVSEILAQVLAENLDLLLVKEVLPETTLGNVKYLISLKGYRDNKDGTPGKLTELARQALPILQGTLPPAPALVNRVLRFAAPKPRVALICRQAL